MNHPTHQTLDTDGLQADPGRSVGQGVRTFDRERAGRLFDDKTVKLIAADTDIANHHVGCLGDVQPALVVHLGAQLADRNVSGTPKHRLTCVNCRGDASPPYCAST